MRQVLGPGALGRPRGIGWRGRWERGSGWGNTCKSMADSFQCTTKPTTIKKNKKTKQKKKKQIKTSQKKKKAAGSLSLLQLRAIA